MERREETERAREKELFSPSSRAREQELKLGAAVQTGTESVSNAREIDNQRLSREHAHRRGDKCILWLDLTSKGPEPKPFNLSYASSPTGLDGGKYTKNMQIFYEERKR
jgi:hypothetical protein